MTVNLGPTFLSGGLAANGDTVMDEPSCPLVQVIGSLIQITDLRLELFFYFILDRGSESKV